MKLPSLNRISYQCIVALIFIVSGCSGGGSPSSTPTPPAPAVSITISPTSANVQTGATLQFSATVTNTTNLAVTWQVNGTTGGSASVGTISTSGLYTAPSSVPSPSTVTIAAVSSADSTKSATATVAVTTPPVSVTVSPTTIGVRTLYTQQFTATVSNIANTAVIWSVNGTTGGSSQNGTVSASGLYTAPSSVPSSPVVTVTTTSVADATKSASAQVTIQAPPVPSGTWSFLGPGGATDLLQLVADPKNSQTLYAVPSTTGGLYKTTNFGNTWSQLSATIGSPVALVIAPASGTLYSLSPDHFQTSTDGGKTFSAAITYPGGLQTGGPPYFTFAVDPKNDQNVYILSSAALMRSRDGGTTWTSLAMPPSPYISTSIQNLGSLVVSSSNSSVLMVASSSGFAISKDGGSTWQLQNNGLDSNYSSLTQIVQDPINPNRILCVGVYPGVSAAAYVYVSTDGGVTWTKQATAGVYDQLAQGQSGPGVYILSEGGLLVTFDGGASYKNIGPANDPYEYTAVFSPLSGNTIAYQGLNDVAVSQDGGKTWTVSENGLNARAMGQIVYAGTSGPLYVATLFSRGRTGSGESSSQLWHAPDANGSWSRVLDMYAGVPAIKFDVDPQNPLHLIGLEQQTQISNGAESSAMSNDGGITWTQIPYAAGMQNQFPLFNFSEVHFGAPSSNSAFACGTFGVARLSTVTNIWTLFNSGIGSGESCQALGVDNAISGRLYVGTTGGVYRSVDNGNNWSLLYQNPGSTASIIVDPKNSNNVYVSGGYGMRSTDAGKTWTPLAVGGVLAINPVNSNLLYVVAYNGMEASSDAGLTWATIPTPVKYLEDVAVTASGTVVISTLGNGVIAFTPN